MPRIATKLTPAADGGWTARKRIPEDVQDAYEKLHGVRWETRFRCGPMTVRAARAKHRDWSNDVEAQINNIRAERKGEGLSLTPKLARALSGEWYVWFTTNHLDRPSPVAHWEQFLERLTDRVFDGVHGRRDPDDRSWNVTSAWEQNYEAREPARAMAADWAETTQFLHAKRMTLDPVSRDLFLDHVCRDLAVALNLLIRRGNGDWSDDTHPREFPKFEPKGDRTLIPEALFKRWVTEKQPAAATVKRWRGVFIKLQEDFPDTSAAVLTAEQAQDWCNSLITPERSAAVVNDVWKSGARTVFKWAVKQKLIARNPFDGISITVPRKNLTRETKAFTDDEVKIILRAALAISKPRTKGEAVRRWVPWLCGYTGARPGEITQLRGSDVIERDGLPAIKITPDAGTVKTRKPRTVPLHEHLIEQGFLAFAKASGSGPLFYNNDDPTKAQETTSDPTNPKKPRYAKAREHLATWVRELGVTDPEVKPNHGWRETFKQIGHRHDISERMLDAIAGHAPISVGRGYGLPTLADMAQAMKQFPRYNINRVSQRST
jgi:integrase